METNTNYILLLEDDYVNYLLYEEYFRKTFSTLIRIHNFSDVIKCLEQKDICAVIIGSSMARLHQLEIEKTIKSISHVPIFVEHEQIDSSGFSSDGVDNLFYISPQTDPCDILSAINDFCSKKKHAADYYETVLN